MILMTDIILYTIKSLVRFVNNPNIVDYRINTSI